MRPDGASSTGDGQAFAASVIIPLFNKAPFVRRTLESVLAQSCPAAEVVIVDDGSTDDSVERIQDLLGPQVRLVRKRNGGPGPARNRGVAEASSEWIAFLDGDDIWMPNHLATLRDLAHFLPEADVLATSFERRTAAWIGVAPTCADRGDNAQMYDLFSDFGAVPRLWTSCTAVRRAVISKSGGFGDFFPGEDFELWARLALDHQIAVSSRTTAIYLRETGGLMDQFESGPSPGITKQPIFDTLDRALSTAEYRSCYPAISKYRQHLLTSIVRQALYRGDRKAARHHLDELAHFGSMRLGILRLISWLPHRVLRAGIRIRNTCRAGLPRCAPSTE